jgi:hypothetical protein
MATKSKHEASIPDPALKRFGPLAGQWNTLGGHPPFPALHFIAYATFGTPNPDRTNVALLPSWYSGDHHGYDFLLEPGGALDPAKYFVIVTEMFANGASSSPSNARPRFDGPGSRRLPYCASPLHAQPDGPQLSGRRRSV